MAMMLAVTTIQVFLVLFLPWSDAIDYSFTFKLTSGQDQCFYEHIKQGATLELEYQVIEGGELDVNFRVGGPNHELIISEDRKMEGLHSFEVTTTGDYSICFDNTFSRISHKLVFMDIIVDHDDYNDDFETDFGTNTMSPDTVVLDMKMQDLRVLLANVTHHLSKVAATQQFFRAREARHRYTLESNNSRVLFWSIIYCLVVITVGVVQVVVLRSLFRSRRQDKITT